MSGLMSHPASRAVPEAYSGSYCSGLREARRLRAQALGHLLQTALSNAYDHATRPPAARSTSAQSQPHKLVLLCAAITKTVITTIG